MIAAVVTRRKTEAAGICSFELAAAAGSALPTFEPGADIEVQLDGRVAKPHSLCSAPWQPGRYMIVVQRDPASLGASLAMPALRVGDVLEISLPLNRFPLVTEAKRTLLFAYGIGITALLPMAEHLAARDEDFLLHYSAGSAAQLAFCKRILLGSVSRHTRFHLDDGPTRQHLAADVALGMPEDGTQVYVCGPADFVEAVLTAARALAWPETRLHRKCVAETLQRRAHPSPASPLPLRALERSA